LRIDIKSVGENDYIQIIDEDGFLHHVGPLNPENLAAAIYTKGLDERNKVRDWLKELYRSRGIEIDEETLSEIRALNTLYHDGLDGFTPRNSEYYNIDEVNRVYDKIDGRMTLHKILKEKFLRTIHRADFPKSVIQEKVKLVYNNLSEERKEEMLKNYHEEMKNKSEAYFMSLMEENQ
jgi:hypothetical protein